jgi:hypothetical protein
MLFRRADRDEGSGRWRALRQGVHLNENGDYFWFDCSNLHLTRRFIFGLTGRAR